MNCRPATLGGAALALLLVVATPLRADLIRWSYSWSRTPEEVQADAPGTGFVSFTDESEQREVVGDSDIVATNLRSHSDATVENPDVFTAKPYTLTLWLQDAASGASGTLTFTGQLDGTLTFGSSNISNTFTGDTTQTLQLGNTEFTVTINTYSPPGPPNSSFAGSIGARALVDVSEVHRAPEPSSLLLSFVGLSFLGLARYRRRFSKV